MARNNTEVIYTTFGTQLRPLNLKEGIFKLVNDSESVMDTPLPNLIGTKQIFKKGSIVNGTFWEEANKKRQTRKVVMVMDGTSGRYLINKNDLKNITKGELAAQKANEEVGVLQNKVDLLLNEAKVEVNKTLDSPKKENALDKEYFGFSAKQILFATIGVILLVKIIK
jgi:hypothetical protein